MGMRLLLLITCLNLSTIGLAADGPLVFEDTVLPVLKAKCASCHFGENPKGGLDLSRKGSIVLGGKSGPSDRAWKCIKLCVSRIQCLACHVQCFVCRAQGFVIRM